MRLELDRVLKSIKGKVVCEIDANRKEFTSAYEAYKKYGNRGQDEEYYVVDAIYADGDAVILDVKDIRPEIKRQVEQFEREHYERFGVYPNRFDGA